ncbi:MAG TPA: hypothetical protein VKD90_27385 [Gemmataceae bacterium]|nr:hypothetical protein [Gemmataceae bacterium]
MDDQREHYGDPAPAWAADPGPDPTGLRACDRAHLAGWIGVFIAFILLGIGIGIVRLLPGRPTADDLLRLVPLGASVLAFGFAGVCLILRTLTDRPPTGPVVLICNAIIVGPFLVPGTLAILAIVPGCLALMIAQHSSAAWYTFWPITAMFVAATAVQAHVLWRNGRRLLRFLRAWLDPTGGQWW